MDIRDWSSDVCSADLAGKGCTLPAARKRHQPRRAGGDQGSDSAGDLGRGETAIYPEGIKLAGVRNVTAIKLDTKYVEKPWGRKDIPAIFPDGTGRPIGEIWLEGPAGRHPPLMVKYTRSEESRVGKECVSTCSSRWSPYH